MKTTHLIIAFLFATTSVIVAQNNGDDDVFNYSAKAEVKKQEKLNESPYAMFGDNTSVLKTKHEENLNHSLIIPIMENNKQISVFELNFQTGITTIRDKNGNVQLEKKLTHNQQARFTSIDPMAEKYYSISPYAYCANNPIKFIDPTGMWIAGADSLGNITLTAEDKDNWDTLAKFMGGAYNSKQISKLWGSNNKGNINLTKELGGIFQLMTDAINEAKALGMPADENGITNNSQNYYNCWTGVINLLEGTGVTGAHAKDNIDQGAAYMEFMMGYDQTNSPSVGVSAMVFMDENGLAHAAINMGKSKSGTRQTFSKDGPRIAPGFRSLNSLLKEKADTESGYNNRRQFVPSRTVPLYGSFKGYRNRKP